MLALHHKMSLTVAAGVSSLCLSFFLSGFIPKWENQFENKNELCFLIMVSKLAWVPRCLERLAQALLTRSRLLRPALTKEPG